MIQADGLISIGEINLAGLLKWKLGLDINFNPNSFSEINLTFKPDFGQINQDASEVNNTAYETYYDEKRGFFIDNALLFSTPINVFYSRRIGDYIKYNYNNQSFQFQSDLNTAFKYTSKINNYSYKKKTN